MTKPAAPPADAHRSGFIAVAGRPNVGKSTLLNGIASDKVSIVSHRKQTTRSVIRAVTDGDNTQIAWLDTPGWQTQHGGSLNRAMNKSAEWAVNAADIILFVTAAASWTRADSGLLKKLPKDKPALAAINKIDLLPDKTELLPTIQTLADKHNFIAIVPLSAKTGDGIGVLLGEARKLLPQQPALFYGTASEQNRPFFFAELLREKMFQHLGDELPYYIGVVTDTISDDENLLSVSIGVYAEKESQKRIIIGRGGGMLKKLATAARLDMEHVSGKKVFLSVRVRVANWRRNAALLQRMQIGAPR